MYGIWQKILVFQIQNKIIKHLHRSMYQRVIKTLKLISVSQCTQGIFYEGTCCKYIFFSKSVNIEDGKEVPSQFQKKM